MTDDALEALVIRATQKLRERGVTVDEADVRRRVVTEHWPQQAGPGDQAKPMVDEVIDAITAASRDDR